MKQFGAFVLVGLLVAFGLVFWMVRVNDPDSYYHIGHALLYFEKGPFYREFPWASASVISKYRADLWWGFHVFLSPLGLLKDPYLALRIAPAILLFLYLQIMRAALVQLKISQWWAFAVLFAASGELMRLQTIRPQSLSTALLVFVFASTVSKNYWLSAAGSLLLGLIHPTLFFILGPVLIASAVALKINREKVPFGILAGVFGLCVLAGCCRPGWIDGLTLMKIQLVDLTLIRRQHILPNFGVELDPARAAYFWKNFAPSIGILLIGLICFQRKKESNGWLVGAILVFAVGLSIGVILTKRGVDQSVPFAMVSALLAFQTRPEFWKVSLAACLTCSAFTLGNYFVSMRTSPESGREAEGASKFLAKNTNPGDVIFHPVWSDFAELFFWNRSNRYLGGMDPIFQFAFSKDLYWKQTLRLDKASIGFVNGYPHTDKSKKLEPFYTAIPRDFKARYAVFLGTYSSWQKHFEKDKVHYKKVYEDDHARVFKIIP